MSSPAAGRADFQAYASWLGTPVIIPATTYSPGTTVIEDLSLANYSALEVLILDVTGNGRVQFQFFTDSTKTQSVDVYQYILNGGNALNLNIPMISPFVEISMVVDAAQSFRAISIFTPNNAPVLRPTYPGQVRSGNEFGLSVAANSILSLSPQYVISGQAYAYFHPRDTTGKLDCVIQAMGSDGNEAYELARFAGPTGPVQQTLIIPPQPIRVQFVNNDGAASHVLDFSLQMIGN